MLPIRVRRAGQTENKKNAHKLHGLTSIRRAIRKVNIQGRPRRLDSARLQLECTLSYCFSRGWQLVSRALVEGLRANGDHNRFCTAVNTQRTSQPFPHVRRSVRRGVAV